MRVDYSDVKAMKEELMEILKDVGAMEAAEECSDVGELHDIFEEALYLSEYVDGQIDIYNHDLREWAVDHWMWVEEAILQGVADGYAEADHCYHRAIMAGQYVYYSAAASEAIEEIFDDINKEEAA